MISAILKTTTMLSMILVLTVGQTTNRVSAEQKQEFIQLVKTLPTKGEFFTEEATKKAGPYVPVLFALNEKDIENYDLYPFLALSRALCDYAKHRQFGARNFHNIQHRKIKLFWAAILIDEGPAPAAIEQFLREALTSAEDTKDLSDMIGPDFDALKQRLRKH